MFFGKAKINSFEKGISREWVLTDGKGGYASLTLLGVPTRKSHGIFSLNGKSLLIKLEERVKVGKKECFLSTNRYSGVVYPDGYRYIISVDFDPLPTYVFSVNEALIRKRFLFHEDRLFINYELISSIEPVRFEIFPLFPGTSEISPSQHPVEAGTMVDVRGERILIRANCGEYKPRPRWYENVEYMEEGIKGAFWTPGFFSFSLEEGKEATIEVSTRAASLDEDFQRLWGMKKRFFVMLSDSLPKGDETLSLLMSIGNTLLLEKGDYKTILSGYFSLKERARETFISLPGLLLSTGRIDDARLCLLRWLDFFNEGGIPYEIEDENGIYKGEEPTLWCIYSLGRFLAYTNDLNFVRGAFEKMESFFSYMMESGRIDEDGLIVEENPANNWMGIELNGEYIVERKGKLVELNALWYNAVSFLSRLGEAYNIKHSYGKMASLIRESFMKTFWLEDEGYLKDAEESSELRPNQILAFSLPFTPVPRKEGRRALNVIWRHLYTTYGLRTLAPLEKKYKGREEGDELQRLKARWRGMAWPWLLGHFFSALRRFYPEKAYCLRTMWMPLLAHLEEGCIGGVAEVFDGSMPYNPHGDIIYAPSQGEIIRSFVEDVEGYTPPYEREWSEAV
ncbi:MAG: glycogen debranching enzyme family protein [Synergistetes bacterium]|nr:glycogen debranching enzyme family protein [Synergistota bacterium]